MIVSLNEIAATAMKAVRGCGHDLGIAEEMAFATRWLCERGLRGAEKLVHALEQFERVEIALEHRAGETHITNPESRPCSPLAIAPSVAELLIAGDGDSRSVTVGSLAHPLLLIPFAARAGIQHGPVQLSWTTIDNSTVAVMCDKTGTHIHAYNPFSLIQARGDGVTLNLETACTNVPVIHSGEDLTAEKHRSIDNGCNLTHTSWKKLETFAHNTYVPISDESRLSGAGAGLTDND